MKLGDKVKDTVTGFEGMATGYVQNLTGADQVRLTPEVAIDGTIRAEQWFDVERIVVLRDSGRHCGIRPIEKALP